MHLHYGKFLFACFILGRRTRDFAASRQSPTFVQRDNHKRANRWKRYGGASAPSIQQNTGTTHCVNWAKKIEERFPSTTFESQRDCKFFEKLE